MYCEVRMQVREHRPGRSTRSRGSPHAGSPSLMSLQDVCQRGSDTVLTYPSAVAARLGRREIRGKKPQRRFMTGQNAPLPEHLYAISQGNTDGSTFAYSPQHKRGEGNRSRQGEQTPHRGGCRMPIERTLAPEPDLDSPARECRPRSHPLRPPP